MSADSTRDVAAPESCAPAAGSAAQPWIARPTRAGWWVVWLTGEERPETLEVSEQDGQMLVYFGELFVIEDIRDEFGGWAGPIKSPGAWDEDPPQIRGVSGTDS